MTRVHCLKKIREALYFYGRPSDWATIQRNGMRIDNSWTCGGEEVCATLRGSKRVLMIDYRTRSEVDCTQESGAFVHNFKLIGSFFIRMKPVRKLAIYKQRSFEERLAQRLRSRKISEAKLRARQAQGKIRRFVNTNFRKQETIASLALRRGECNRCGACCELVFKCPFLKKNPDGTSLCGIYENRPQLLSTISHRAA
jgi:hypothetical protein